MKKILARLSRWICQIKTKASKATVHFKEWICKAGNKAKNFLEDDDKIDKIILVFIWSFVGIVVIGSIVFTTYTCTDNAKLRQDLITAEQSLATAEQNLHNMEQELQTANQENLELSKMVEELQKYKDEMEQQRFMEKLEEMKNNPWTPTLDFLPYLQGDFEENVRLMAVVINKEAGNGGDEEQQMQGLVLLARCFHPNSFSDGNGNLRSAILCEGQYPWATESNIYSIKPNENSIRNARAVLTGQVLDTPNIKGATRNVEYANTKSLGYKTYCKIWNASSEKWVYFDYGY